MSKRKEVQSLNLGKIRHQRLFFAEFSTKGDFIFCPLSVPLPLTHQHLDCLEGIFGLSHLSGSYWYRVGEAKEAVEYPIMYRMPPHNKILQPQMSIVLRLRKPALKDRSGSPWITWTLISLTTAFADTEGLIYLIWTMFPFPGGASESRSAFHLLPHKSLKWKTGLDIPFSLPVFEAFRSGPWQLAHNKFPRHNLNVISGLGLGHEYLRCKLFVSYLNLLWILLDEKRMSHYFLIKFVFPLSY